jgi:hypothetical protein
MDGKTKLLEWPTLYAPENVPENKIRLFREFQRYMHYKIIKLQKRLFTMLPGNINQDNLLNINETLA